jgi:hypothetical protein
VVSVSEPLAGVPGILERVRAIRGAVATAEAARSGFADLLSSAQDSLASATSAPARTSDVGQGFHTTMARGAWGGFENGRIPASALVDVHGFLLAPSVADNLRALLEAASRTCPASRGTTRPPAGG